MATCNGSLASGKAYTTAFLGRPQWCGLLPGTTEEDALRIALLVCQQGFTSSTHNAVSALALCGGLQSASPSGICDAADSLLDYSWLASGEIECCNDYVLEDGTSSLVCLRGASGLWVLVIPLVCLFGALVLVFLRSGEWQAASPSGTSTSEGQPLVPEPTIEPASLERKMVEQNCKLAKTLLEYLQTGDGPRQAPSEAASLERRVFDELYREFGFQKSSVELQYTHVRSLIFSLMASRFEGNYAQVLREGW